MARALVLTRDLLFGSQVQGALTAAGHEVELVADEPRLRERLAAASGDAGRPVEVLVVDLTDGDLEAAATVLALSDDVQLDHVRTLGFYSHVEPEARERAERAGVELVVPRSRMAREGPELVAGLLSTR
jgi:uncharacterized protein YbjT (DUF2867 family)